MLDVVTRSWTAETVTILDTVYRSITWVTKGFELDYTTISSSYPLSAIIDRKWDSNGRIPPLRLYP